MPSAGIAQTSATPSIEEQQKTAAANAEKVAKAGPVQVALSTQAVLNLPAGYRFIPVPEAGDLLRSWGNRPSQDLLGVIVSDGEGDWFVIARFIPAGYIKDDDAKNWNVDELLTSLREGTEETNRERRERGFSELELKGWIERPDYDAATHRLVWSVLGVKKNAPDPDGSVNYNTYMLGREGYISLNFVTTQAMIAGEKKFAKELLAAVSFTDGKAYGDFNASTDRVAEYGLAALVGGAVAKKLGWLALLGAFAAKFAKIIFVGFAALAAAIGKFFRRGGSKNPQG
nr:DUF2167 domain-containing protein [Microvirga terricola]